MEKLVSRRTLITGACTIGASFLVGGFAFASEEDNACLRPPGAQDYSHFNATCIRCNRCVSVCPQNCLRFGTLEEGILAYRTPILDFHKGICDFCGKCEYTCPTGAITNISEDASVIGTAVVDAQRCIAYLGRGCNVCTDACIYSAISLNDAGCPVVDAALCNGCGRCENKCPSNVYLTYGGDNLRGINVQPAQEA